MSKDDKPTKLEPRLRFPRFRNAAGWSVKRLGGQGDFLSSLTGKSGADFDTGDAVFIPYMNVFSNTFTDLHDVRAVNVGEGETQNAVARGDVFFTVSSETPEDAGMSSVLLGDIENCYLNSFCALFRFHEGRSPDPVFLGYALRSGVVRKHLARGAQGATRYNISKGVFRDVPLLLPEPAEQRKVAECLGSLDDWIAAETEALAALRRHKTGLMQQLFPRPGETRPRLRFPEFKDGPAWDTPAMSDIYGFRPTNSLSRDQLNYDEGVIYNIHYGDIHTKFQSLFRIENERVPRVLPAIAEELGDRLHLCQEGDIILADASEDLNDVGKAIELISLGGQRVVSGTHTIHATRLGDKPAIGFGGYLFQSEAVRRGIHKEAQGAKVYGISPTRVGSVVIPMPRTKEEQRKIAECLSSLDTQIFAQSEKLTALVDHKIGLMQQLFPSPDTADGGG